MTNRIIYILTIFALLTSCNCGGKNKTLSAIDTLTTTNNVLTNNENYKSQIIEIDCDSIFKNKGYKLKLIHLNTDKENETNYNFIFLMFNKLNGQTIEIYRDTIISTIQEIKFADFNNDNVKDILIQNISDARSNWTYNLYLVDIKQDKLKKVKGFEEIKNPNYLPKLNLIDNVVVSGRNWTSFYKIQGDSIKDFNIVIYSDEDSKGKVAYDLDYKKAINTIMEKEKNNR